MRKILLSICALAMCVGMMAQTRIYSTYEDAKSTLSCELGTVTYKSVEYTALTFSIENNDQATGYELYIKYADNSKINGASRESVIKGRDDSDDANYYYTFVYNTVDNSQFGIPFVQTNWNPSAEGDIAPISSGKYCTLRVDKSATGSLSIDGSVFDAKGQGYNLPYLTVDLGATGINSISSDDTNTPAYNISGQRVSNSAKGIVIKHGKKCVAK